VGFWCLAIRDDTVNREGQIYDLNYIKDGKIVAFRPHRWIAGVFHPIGQPAISAEIYRNPALIDWCKDNWDKIEKILMNDICYPCANPSCSEKILGGIICPICNIDKFCSHECLWESVSRCTGYRKRRDTLEQFTPRSVVDRLVDTISRDKVLLAQLLKMRKKPTHMLVFVIQDLDMLCELLSNSEDWKKSLTSGVESVPINSSGIGDSLLLCFICQTTKESFFRQINHRLQ
jgi:hypothetical protein